MSLPAFSPPDALLPPWDWNPAQTFQTAYNTQRIADQKTEEMRLGNELERILLPAKVAKAEYEMKKLGYDSQLLEKIYRTQSAALDNSYRGLSSAIGGGGGGGGGGGSNAPANNQQNSASGVIDFSGFQFGGSPQTPAPSGKIKLPE
jgi:hypothetical protein